MPRLTLTHWVIIVRLAVVTSAFGFTLWNDALRTVSAMESSVINDTMLFQIALLAWVFLGERLSGPEAVEIALAGLGMLLMQMRRAERRCNALDNALHLSWYLLPIRRWAGKGQRRIPLAKHPVELEAPLAIDGGPSCTCCPRAR